MRSPANCGFLLKSMSRMLRIFVAKANFLAFLGYSKLTHLTDRKVRERGKACRNLLFPLSKRFFSSLFLGVR